MESSRPDPETQIVRVIFEEALTARGLSEIPWPKESEHFARTLYQRTRSREESELRRVAESVADALIDRMIARGCSTVSYLTPPTAFPVGTRSYDVALDCCFWDGERWVDPDPESRPPETTGSPGSPSGAWARARTWR